MARNFKEALTYTLVNTNINRKDLQFPLIFSKAFAETTVREIELSERAKNVLGRGKIVTMQDLMNKFDEVAKIRSCGKQTVREIKNGFLQRWYEILDDYQVTEFWEEFIIINSRE